MSIDLKFVELTTDILIIFFVKYNRWEATRTSLHSAPPVRGLEETGDLADSQRWHRSLEEPLELAKRASKPPGAYFACEACAYRRKNLMVGGGINFPYPLAHTIYRLGWCRLATTHCTTCRSLHELDRQGTVFFSFLLCFRRSIPAGGRSQLTVELDNLCGVENIQKGNDLIAHLVVFYSKALTRQHIIRPLLSLEVAIPKIEITH